ncbi:hypothetical protein VKT23_008653 [Stygiomarasmius scandens]|uniref:C2H2-type domain-containing protein n=1 Tax=Marasmiellus scandens TaxID=2682957 RepID=A0ABR1JHY1_9AGAR
MVSLSIPLRNILTSDLVVYVESTTSDTETPSFLMKPRKIPNENSDDHRFIRPFINEATLNVHIDKNLTECGKSVLSIGVEFSPVSTEFEVPSPTVTQIYQAQRVLQGDLECTQKGGVHLEETIISVTHQNSEVVVDPTPQNVSPGETEASVFFEESLDDLLAKINDGPLTNEYLLGHNPITFNSTAASEQFNSYFHSSSPVQFQPDISETPTSGSPTLDIEIYNNNGISSASAQQDVGVIVNEHYICPIPACSKQYKRHANLLTHLQRHQKPKKNRVLACSYQPCHATFSREHDRLR